MGGRHARKPTLQNVRVAEARGAFGETSPHRTRQGGAGRKGRQTSGCVWYVEG